jgi:hypothetical protein
MKNVILFLSIFSMLASCAPCVEGMGDVTDERRLQTAFSKLVISGDFDVTVETTSPNTTPYVVVQAQENVIPHIVTELKGDQMTFSVDGCIQSSQPIKIVVVNAGLQEIEKSGSGKLLSYMPYLATKMKFSNTGSGDLVFKVYSEELSVVNSGSGNIIIQGVTRDLSIDNRGSGEVKTDMVKTENAVVDSRGSGDVWLHAASSLDIQLSGSGNVLYRGEPQNLQQKNTGSGNIRRAS